MNITEMKQRYDANLDKQFELIDKWKEIKRQVVLLRAENKYIDSVLSNAPKEPKQVVTGISNSSVRVLIEACERAFSCKFTSIPAGIKGYICFKLSELGVKKASIGVVVGVERRLITYWVKMYHGRHPSAPTREMIDGIFYEWSQKCG
jgi:hypothetical protein